MRESNGGEEFLEMHVPLADFVSLRGRGVSPAAAVERQPAVP